MKYLVPKDLAAELEGVTVREIERRAAAGEVRTQKSATPARNRTYPMMCDVRSLSAAAQQKFMQHKLSGATGANAIRVTAPGGQLARNRSNLGGELTTPSSSSSQGFLFSPPPAIPEDQRLLLSAADLATAEQRLNAIAPMLDFKNGTAAAITVGGKTISNLDDLAAYLAAQRGVSPRTLWDWYTRFRKHGFSGLARTPRSEKGKSRFFRQYPKAAEFVLQKYLNERLSIELTLSALEREWPRMYNHGSQPCKYSALRQFLLKNTPRAVRVLAREGEEKFNADFRPHILRDWSKLAVNDVWISDHVKHDVFSSNDLDLPGVAPSARMRLWLTTFVDARSRRVMGAAWSANPSSESISSALRMAVAQFGVPREFYIDNGEDYKKASKQIELTPELSGFMARCGAKITRALPYQAQSKPIESWHRTLHQRFDILNAPYYCGPDSGRRPDDCELALKEHDRFLKGKPGAMPLAPASEFIQMAAYWIFVEFNAKFNHSGHGMNGRTAAAIYDEQLPPEKRTPMNPRDLAPLFWSREKRVLREGGCVQICNSRYEPADGPSAAAFQLHHEKEVIVACDPYNLGEAIGLDLDGNYLGTWVATERRNWGLSREQLRADMRNQRKLGQVSKAFLSGLARRTAHHATELDVLRANAGITIEAQPAALALPAEATAPMRQRRLPAISAAAAAAPDYSADVAERLRALREEGAGD